MYMAVEANGTSQKSWPLLPNSINNYPLANHESEFRQNLLPEVDSNVVCALRLIN